MTTNDYFDYKNDSNRIVDGIVARSQLWNRIFDLLTEAFDMLPDSDWYDSVTDSLEAIAAGSAVLVSGNDGYPGTLSGKITSTDNSVDMEEVNDGNDESFDLSVDKESLDMFYLLF